jgi:hypothetical protein
MYREFAGKKLNICVACFFFIVCLIGTSQASAAEKKSSEQLSGLQEVLDTVKKSVSGKNFQLLKRYLSGKGSLTWAPCGPSDMEAEKISFAALVTRLSEIAKGAEINIYGAPDISPWNAEKSVFVVDITTEGWTGEYPYLSFEFEYVKANNQCANNQWRFHGVCESVAGPFGISTNSQKYGTDYYAQPQLPRPGPRVFKDRLALRYRIEELVHFKAFDALRPYAIRKNVGFEKCSHEMLDKDAIRESEVPVDQVITFLKKNSGHSKEIKPVKGHYYKYLETEGWSGEYPYVSFWFQESKKGWEWTGVAYCKNTLMHIRFPDEPRFK